MDSTEFTMSEISDAVLMLNEKGYIDMFDFDILASRAVHKEFVKALKEYLPDIKKILLLGFFLAGDGIYYVFDIDRFSCADARAIAEKRFMEYVNSHPDLYEHFHVSH